MGVPGSRVRGMRVALTGSAGFVGANLVRALLDGGAEVHAFVHPASDVWRLADIAGDIEIHRVDLLDGAGLAHAMVSIAPDAVVNLATSRRDGTHDDRAKALATNLVGASNLLEATKAVSYQRLVHLGTFLEHGQSFYGSTKAAATLMCRRFADEHSRPVVVLRPYSTYGPWQPPDRLIPAAIVAARDGSPLELTAGRHRRDWLYVADVVEACLLAIVTGETAGEIIDLGTGRLSTNADVVRAAENATGALVASRPGRHPPRPWDADGAVAPTAKAKAVLGWIARHDLEAGVRATAEWMEDRMDLYRPRPAQSV